MFILSAGSSMSIQNKMIHKDYILIVLNIISSFFPPEGANVEDVGLLGSWWYVIR